MIDRLCDKLAACIMWIVHAPPCLLIASLSSDASHGQNSALCSFLFPPVFFPHYSTLLFSALTSIPPKINFLSFSAEYLRHPIFGHISNLNHVIQVIFLLMKHEQQRPACCSTENCCHLVARFESKRSQIWEWNSGLTGGPLRSHWKLFHQANYYCIFYYYIFYKNITGYYRLFLIYPLARN